MVADVNDCLPKIFAIPTQQIVGPCTMVRLNSIAASHGVKTKAAVFLLCWFSSSAVLINAVSIDCNFYQDLLPGNTYYVYNPQYPYRYQGQQSCMWTMKSEYRVNFTCTTFQLPWSYNCTQDRLSVQPDISTTHRYCGDGTFSVISKSNTLTVTLETPTWSTGGRFLCEARPIERPNDSDTCRCGWKNPTRIVGGTNTGVNEFPMMAGMVDATIRDVFCGSTIISPRHVITAAHCMAHRDMNKLGVLVGEYDLSRGDDTNATSLYRVAEIIIHPNYDEKRVLNDLAIVKIQGKMNFGNEIGPACLPFQHSPDTFGGSFVDLLGWGSTEFGGAPSEILQKVTVSVMTNLECSKYYSNLTPEAICTYSKGKDSCQMDSGGPVLWQNPTTRRIVLIGIISSGVGCAIVSGVNTRVGAYIDWIVSVTSDTSYCIVE